MAAPPLRQWLVPFDSTDEFDGMFVVNRSRAPESVPRLPVLRLSSSAQPAGEQTAITASSLAAPNLARAFDDGDVIWLDSRRKLARSILSRRANANTLLVTERCDNRCNFCSQPPNDLPDVALYRDATIALLNFGTDEYVGISGGEPTLNRPAFLSLLQNLEDFACPTKLHVLSNGRSFADECFAGKVSAAAGTRTVLWGIPLYGHRSSLHDALVGQPDAFAETVTGLLNICSRGFNVELRVIPTQQNIAHLPAIVRFVVSSFPGIGLISVMNIEPKGWARANYAKLYVPVRDQNASLMAAVEVADSARRHIRLFNYPLCLLTEELRPFCVRSISDWKNYYPQECADCRLLSECGGFFSSASGLFREAVEVQE